MMVFAYPDMFILLVLPILVYYLAPRAKGLHGDALRITFLQDLAAVKRLTIGSWFASSVGKTKKSNIRFSIILLALIYILLCIAAARPQWTGDPIRIKNEGRDILMVMDISTSMREMDFMLERRNISRLLAVKAVASGFIDNRQDDRIGLVLFGTRAYLQSPLTFDKKSVKDILWDMDAGMAGNSTAIGDALGVALKSLKDSPNKDNKVIILLTDGENNDGALSLPQAISLAKSENVKIYTIGVGSAGSLTQSILGFKYALTPGLDEESLKVLAKETEGRYFRAANTESLVNVYKEIDRLEPQSYDNNYVREIREYYYIPLFAAIILSILLIFIRRRNM